MRALVLMLAIALLIAPMASRAATAKPDPVALGDVLSVPIDGPCPPITDVQKYTLLVDGAVTGIAGQGCREDALVDGAGKVTGFKEVYIQFMLRKQSDPPAPETAVAWQTLIGAPSHSPGDYRMRTIRVGIMDDKGHEIASANSTMRFEWSPVWKVLAGVLAFVGIVVLFGLLGARTALLRDVGAVAAPDFEGRTFSLARTQMAWWTVIFVGSYIFEWIASGTMPPLSKQALALMGIYSVLTVTSRGVDLHRKTQFPAANARAFFRDLVSDESGVAIHRVQMLVFTVVVGLMFIYQVLTTASMPELEPYTLTMIGISGATYIGLKSTEPQPKTEGDDDASSQAASSAGAKSGYSEGEVN